MSTLQFLVQNPNQVKVHFKLQECLRQASDILSETNENNFVKVLSITLYGNPVIKHLNSSNTMQAQTKNKAIVIDSG